jgi:hypothetical protein
MPNLIDIAKPLISVPFKVAGQADGLVRRLRGGGDGEGSNQATPQVTDPTLKAQVESALYKTPGVTRSKVKVTVADGVVTVHGEARNQAQMATIETATRAVAGVRGFESQLHLPKTPAPSTPKAGTRQAKATKPAAKTKAATRGRTERVNRDKTAAATPKAEPTPAKAAARRQGRKPAPLGSTDPATTGSPDTQTTPKPPAGTTVRPEADGAAVVPPVSDLTSGTKPENS